MVSLCGYYYSDNNIYAAYNYVKEWRPDLTLFSHATQQPVTCMQQFIMMQHIWLSVLHSKCSCYNLLLLGYVLDCLPSANDSWKTIANQLHFLRNLKLPPDIIVNLKVQCVTFVYTYTWPYT